MRRWLVVDMFPLDPPSPDSIPRYATGTALCLGGDGTEAYRRMAHRHKRISIDLQRRLAAGECPSLDLPPEQILQLAEELTDGVSPTSISSTLSRSTVSGRYC